MEKWLAYTRLIICSVYISTFAFGVIGNLSVLFFLLKLKFFSQNVDTYSGNSAARRSMIYIVLLALADLLVLLTVPFSMAFILDVQWQFGALICRLHSTIDITGKLFSVVTLTCISLERYFSVKPNWRSTKAYWCMRTVPLSLGVMVCIAVPVVPWALYTDSYDTSWESDSGKNVTTTMCINTMPDGMFLLFVSYLLTCGFICPLFVMSACYYLLVRHVKRRLHERLVSGAMARQPKYVCKLTRSIWRVSAFHFICWTPFWFFTVAPTLVVVFELNVDLEGDNWLVYGRMFTNLLPYINSSGNWIFYAALNRDVRKRIENEKKRSISKIQSGAHR